ncbi:MAG: hypothetical protein IPL50_10845 [Chitinophagaceae bacterium]|nr:hypothetical protein [Chitinophagaceae bacterium]
MKKVILLATAFYLLVVLHWPTKAKKKRNVPKAKPAAPSLQMVRKVVQKLQKMQVLPRHAAKTRQNQLPLACNFVC